MALTGRPTEENRDLAYLRCDRPLRPSWRRTERAGEYLRHIVAAGNDPHYVALVNLDDFRIRVDGERDFEPVAQTPCSFFHSDRHRATTGEQVRNADGRCDL